MDEANQIAQPLDHYTGVTSRPWARGRDRGCDRVEMVETDHKTLAADRSYIAEASLAELTAPTQR